MIRSLLVLSLTCISLPLARAGTLHDQIQAQIETYENSVRANTMKIIEAQTEEEKAKYRATIPSAAPYATEVLTLVKSSLDDPEAVHGVSWLITQCIQFPEGQEAIGLLAQHFAEREEIAQAIKKMEHYPPTMVAPALEAVVARNTHPEVRAAASFALGMHQFRLSESGSDETARNEARTQAMQHFQTIVAEYPEVTVNGFRMADQAAAMLFEIANLSVGATAPEITGTDQHGKNFSLSEYRGRHVLLVFWGEWCHGCHGFMPLLAKLGDQFKEEPFALLGVNTDSAEVGREALAKLPFDWRCWLDGSTSGPITSEWNLHHFPTLYLLSPDGVILAKNPSLQQVEVRLTEAYGSP